MILLAPTFLATLGASAAGDPCPSSPPPNFLVVLIDDVGLEQLQIYCPHSALDCCRVQDCPTDLPYPFPHTPTIDALAQHGVRFTQARANPLCSPTRAAMQSGYYGTRTGCGSGVVMNNTSENFRELGICPAPPVTSLAQMLGSIPELEETACEYTSGLFGKVHLQLAEGGPQCGYGDTYVTEVLGYDHFEGADQDDTPDFPATCLVPVGAECGVENHLNEGHPPQCAPPEHVTRYTEVSRSYYKWKEDDGVQTTEEIVHGDCTNAPPFCSQGSSEDYYYGEYLTRKERLAVQDWVLDQTRPFLAVWSMTAAHVTWQWPPKSADPSVETHGFLKDEPGHCIRNTRLRAVLEYADSSIGLLLEALETERPGILDNTYILLMGDNGLVGLETVINPDPPNALEPRYPLGHPSYQAGDESLSFDMTPYEQLVLEGKVKASAFEAGVRVPLIVSGPDVVACPTPGCLGRASAALVDLVDVYATIRELALTRIGAAYLPDNGRDSISFAPVLWGSKNAATHARQCSFGGIFQPNGAYQTLGVTPMCPDPGCTPSPAPLDPDDLRSQSMYYIRRDVCGNLWKVVVRREYDGSTSTDLADVFYNLKNTPYELGSYELPHTGAYADVRAEFDLLLGGMTIQNVTHFLPMSCP